MLLKIINKWHLISMNEQVYTQWLAAYRCGTIWLRKNVLVNSGSSAFLAVVLRAHIKHWYSKVSMHSTIKQQHIAVSNTAQ